MNLYPSTPLSKFGQRMLSSIGALLPLLALSALAVPSVRADVIFTRSSVTGEGWASYSATFTPAYSGNYTLGFNITAGGPSDDNAILIDAVRVSSGPVNTLFSDGFETPDLPIDGPSYHNTSLGTGNWVCTNFSGILDGSPPNWGLAGQGLGFADGTRQYAFLQAYTTYRPSIKAANTIALVAGQTYTVSFYQASRRDFGGTTTYTVTLDAPPPVTVFASGISPVITWNPIFPAAYNPNWVASESNPSGPTVGPNANWVNPHAASVFPLGSHPWENFPPMDFDANWINAWSNLGSGYATTDVGGPGPGQSWTKYSTMVTGEGQFVLQFLADNLSWIYIDDVLVGYQGVDWANGTGRYTISLTGADPHELSFIIYDGGGSAGGKFRLETVQSFQENNPGEELPPPPPPSDTTAPVIAGPGDITAEATGPAGAVVTYTATAVDDVDGPVLVDAIPSSGSTFPLGDTTVGLGAFDAAGNMAYAAFNVKVQDTTPPSITAPATVTVEATSAAGAVATFTTTATDIVSGLVTVNASPASGSTFALGGSTVSLSATDAAGNTARGSIAVTVQDTTPPVITPPADITAEATSSSGAVVTFTATATDAVSGLVSVSASSASGSTFALGNSTVRLSAADAAGNPATASFNVKVQDTTAPVIASLTPSSATLWSPNHKMIPITVTAVASDSVGITSLKISSVTSNEPDNGGGDGDTAGDIQITGNMTVNLRAERSGNGNGRIYTITVEAKDAAGLTTTKTVTVTVPKSQKK